MRSRGIWRGLTAAFAVLAVCLTPLSVRAQSPLLKIAIPGSLTGIGTFYGAPVVEGARIAFDEANAEPGAPRIAMEILDDKSTVIGATALAHQVIEGDALVAVGPDLTVIATPMSKVYREGGVAAIVPTAHGDDIPKAATAFQPIFNTRALGEALANYLHYVLHGTRAAMIYQSDAFGTPIGEGFRMEAEHLSIAVEMLPFGDAAERDRIAA